MKFGNTVKNWQKAIIAEAEKKIGRPLEKQEHKFIISRSSFMALGMIHDTIKASEKHEVEKYLSSEYQKK
ncbi:MAG: hypothetical protein WC947_06025 [Elusimicrobiota bacterium]